MLNFFVIMPALAFILLITMVACKSQKKSVTNATPPQMQVQNPDGYEQYLEMPNVGNIQSMYPKDMISNGSAEPQNIVIRTDGELKEFCTKNRLPLPEITENVLQKYDLAIVYAGQMPSGGYRLTIDKVAQPPTGGTIVLYTLHTPTPDCATTDALTYPIATALMPKIRSGCKFLGNKKNDGC